MNGLLGTTSAEQYYTKSQQFTTTSTQASNGEYTLTVSNLPASEADFMVFVNGTEINPSTYTYNSSTGVIDITSNLPVLNDTVLVEFLDRELGDYRYISFQNLVNNFVIGYVGNGKLIGHADRSEIIFHVKRGIQEFSYDVSRVEKIQEVEVPPSLTIPMPQDYVSYVGIHWIDDNGAEHPVFPARFTSRPSESVAQADNGDYLFDEAGGVLTLNPSVTENRFDSFNQDVFTGSQQNDDYFLYTHYIANRLHTFSSRYGIDPQNANINGVFVVDEVNGQFGFDSSMNGRVITIKYVSDGLATDGEMKIHKMAEDALYKYTIFNMLSTRANVPEYVVNRYRKERRAAMRNAKLRLSNLNIKELTQVMKGKSKHIKH
jgi:hypothetical protein